MNIMATEIGKRIQAALTAKDFKALGGILKKYRLRGKIIEDVVEWLKDQNPQFDEDRFREFVGSFYKAAEKTEYQKFFQKKLEEHGVSSPAELDDDAKKKFFDEVDAGWKGEGEKKEASVSRQHVAEKLLAAAELLAGEVPPEFKKQWDKGKKDDSKKEASEDILSFSVPLLIRIMEYSKEDAETDMDLHVAVENMLRLGKDGVPLTMDDYDEIVGGASGD